uniref:IP18436p n=2 Tax=Drosophila melanogaster TaxID=7227 RepID=A2VEV2_DROME|nr:uncharacterized protein Dmel_CG34323 [Drosophila melanogaster]ABN49410.1 IP18436p [Drosophila melanogaster]ABN49421.1 IP18536p [Drosophila melanogaster]ABW09400.1 uncharacterized protein Dmel_CG34323 [Drosophila melanogaster]AOQ12171.1 CG34323-PA [synthetic construct]|eukprot:NP_001096962.1 uncharacterized protein Dmel_CG34323 [Drosophila melanogaster]
MTFYLEHVLTGDRINLNEGIQILGRHSSCTWVLKYDYMSRYHALIHVNQGDIFIKEMETNNGIFLNYWPTRIGSSWCEVNVGDVLYFGVQLGIEHDGEIPNTFGIFTVKSSG